MISKAHTGRYQSGAFRRLVLLYMMQAIVFSITGMVDCAVTGHVWGAEGLAGMKLAMPVFAVLYLLFGSVLSSGLSVQVTQLLAKGKREAANQCLLWACAAAAILSVLLLLSACLFSDPLTTLFTGRAGGGTVYVHARNYLLPILFGSFPIIMHGILSAVAALEGAARRMTVSVAVVLVSDILGDLLAVKLDAGLRGIAIASVAAYLCACLVLSGQFLSGKTIFRFAPLHWKEGILPAVIVSGLPMAVKGLCEFFTPLAVNRLMLRYGSVSGLAALSIQDAAHYFPLSFCEGLSAAVLLLTGMHFAEQDGESLTRERRLILRYGILYGSFWAFALAFAAPLFLRFFTADASLLGLSVSAFRWYLLGVPFVSLNYAVRSYLQGMGRQRSASIFALTNLLLLPVSLTWLLGRLRGIPGIFAAFAVHEIVLVLCFACWLLHRRRRGDKPLGEESWQEPLAEMRRDLTNVQQVVEASDALIRLCRAHGVDERQAIHTGLCLEELGTNSIQHGFKRGRQGHVELRFLLTDQWLFLRLRDNGRPFDLTERYQLLNPEDPSSNLGLRLVFAAADTVSYSHTFDLNHVCIRIPVAKEPDPLP